MVSVVIPTYNRANYIAETLGSVLAQTHREFEVIVIDDGSTDHTEEVVAQFKGRVRYEKQRNVERSVARNHGLSLAKGDFVSFLDSDDCWHPEALDRMLAGLRENPGAALVAAGCDIVHGRDVVQNFYPGGGTDGILDGAFQQLLRSNVIGSPSAVLLRRSVLSANGSFDEDRRLLGVEDWELWTRLAHDHPLLCLRGPLVRYRRHDGNSPLVGMRLRYPWLVQAVLRNVRLSENETSAVRESAARRMLDYADEFSSLGKLEAVSFCLSSAKEFDEAVASSTSFRRLAAEIPDPRAVSRAGFTTTISTKEQISLTQAVDLVLERVLAESRC
jgi:glycosyltransferase involved in cell wall biosynthesis